MTDIQRNKEVVVGFLRTAFTEKRPADAEDDLVCTHSLLRLTPGSRGSAIADVMRVRDGRIVWCRRFRSRQSAGTRWFRRGRRRGVGCESG